MAPEPAASQPISPTVQAAPRATIRAATVVAIAAALVLSAVGCSGSNAKADTKAARRAQSSDSADTNSGREGTKSTKRPAPTTSTTTRPGTAAATTAPVGGTTTSPRTGTPQPGAPQTGAPRTGTPQPGAPQPGVPQPGVPQPGVPQPGAPQTAPPGSTPSAPPQQVAVKAQVIQQDLPAGWGSVPASGLYAALLPCLGGAGGAGQPTAQVDGDHYSIGAPDQQVQVLTTTAVFPSVDVAKRVLDASSTPQFGQCATGVLTSQAQIAGPRGGPLVRVSGLPTRGDQSVWFRAGLTAADPTGGDTPSPVDALISPIRTGSTVSYLFLVSTGSRVDQGMITDLSQGLADRQR